MTSTELADELMEAASPYSHTVLARACGPDADSGSVEAKVSLRGEPDADQLQLTERSVRLAYRDAFDREPARVAVVVLPFIATDVSDD